MAGGGMSDYKAVVTSLSAPTRAWSCLVLIGIILSFLLSPLSVFPACCVLAKRRPGLEVHLVQESGYKGSLRDMTTPFISRMFWKKAFSLACLRAHGASHASWNIRDFLVLRPQEEHELSLCAATLFLLLTWICDSVEVSW